MVCRDCVALREVVDAVVAEQRAAQVTYAARGLAVGPAHREWTEAWERRVGVVNRFLARGGGVVTTRGLAEQVSALMDEGLDEGEIAARLRIPVARVERIADGLAGVSPGDTAPVAGKSAKEPPGAAAAPSTRPTCGKPHGYGAHRRHGEEPCDACRAAMSEYQRQYRARRAARKTPPPRQRLSVAFNKIGRWWYVYCPCCRGLTSTGHATVAEANAAAARHVTKHRESA